MSLKKQYLPSKPICRVTFRLSKAETNAAETVNLVGEFNNWDTTATPMKKSNPGNFWTTVSLAFGKEFQYKYLVNGNNWINDPAADKYVHVPDMGTDNSVVVIDTPAPAEEPKKAVAPRKAEAEKPAAKIDKAA